MPDRIRLDGRVAVVTGAAGVIGTATMRLLAERGARIVAVDRREDDLEDRDQGSAGLGAGAAGRGRRHPRGRGRRLCPRRGRQIRHHRRLLQQRRHRGRRRADHPIFARSVSPRPRRQRGRRVSGAEACAAGDAETSQRFPAPAAEVASSLLSRSFWAYSTCRIGAGNAPGSR